MTKTAPKRQSHKRAHTKKRRTPPEPELASKLASVQHEARDLTRIRAIFSTSRVLLRSDRATDGELGRLSLFCVAQLVRRAVHQVSVGQSFVKFTFDHGEEAGPSVEDIVVEQLSVSLDSEDTDLVSDLIAVVKPLQTAISAFEGSGLDKSKRLVGDIGSSLSRIEHNRLHLLESLRALEALGLDAFRDCANELQRASSGSTFDPNMTTSLPGSGAAGMKSLVSQVVGKLSGDGQPGASSSKSRLGNLANIGSAIARVRRQLKEIRIDQSKLCIFLSESALLCTGVNAGEEPDKRSKQLRDSIRRAITKLRVWNPSQKVADRMHLVQERFRLRGDIGSVDAPETELLDELPPELRELGKEIMEDVPDSDQLSEPHETLPAEDDLSWARRRRTTQKISLVFGIGSEDPLDSDQSSGEASHLSVGTSDDSRGSVDSSLAHTTTEATEAPAVNVAERQQDLTHGLCGIRLLEPSALRQAQQRPAASRSAEAQPAAAPAAVPQGQPAASLIVAPTAGRADLGSGGGAARVLYTSEQPPDSAERSEQGGRLAGTRPAFVTQTSTLNGCPPAKKKHVLHRLPPASARTSTERSPRKPVALTPRLEGSSWRRLGPARDECSDSATQRTMTGCTSWDSLPGCFSHAADLGDARAAERRARVDGFSRDDGFGFGGYFDFHRPCTVRFDFESDDGYEFMDSSVPALPPVEPPTPTKPVTPQLLTAMRSANGRHADAGNRSRELPRIPGRTTRLVVIGDPNCSLARAARRDPTATTKRGLRSGAVAKETRSRACFGHRGAGCLEVHLWGWEHEELSGCDTKCVVPSLPFG